MKPRSGLWLVRAAFSFFASNASDAESVRDLTIVSSELSAPTSVSVHPLAELPLFAAHPERRSLDAPPTVEREEQLPAAAPLFATQATGSRASGRRDTEYISAAREDTATASSNSATSSSPIMKPRRSRFPDRPSPATSIPPSCRPRCYAELPAHRPARWLSRPRMSCRYTTSFHFLSSSGRKCPA